MSNVRVEERTEGKLELFINSRSLAKYTIQITANPKVFVSDYQISITNKIVDMAISIHTDLWTANNIRVTNSEEYEERRTLQERACATCNSLLALIDIAKGVFHLSTKRVKYWASLVVTVRNKARAWRTSDAKRYIDYR